MDLHNKRKIKKYIFTTQHIARFLLLLLLLLGQSAKLALSCRAYLA